jgi:hypothetical protein
MGIYATLGVAQAFTGFLNGTIIAFVVHSASKRLHHVGSPCMDCSLYRLTSCKDAISRVMHSPMSFFETTVRTVGSSETPVLRIIVHSRLGVL